MTTLRSSRGVTVQPIMEYEAALTKARAFHRDHPRCHIKVLPMSGTETFNLLGFAPAESPEPIAQGLRQEIVDTLVQVARDSSDDDARRDAFDLLKQMGAMN